MVVFAESCSGMLLNSYQYWAVICSNLMCPMIFFSSVLNTCAKKRNSARDYSQELTVLRLLKVFICVWVTFVRHLLNLFVFLMYEINYLFLS